MGTKGEMERGQTARQPRNTRQAGGAEDKRREDRKGGEERGTRMALRLGSGGGDHGSRQGAERDQTGRGKKDI